MNDEQVRQFIRKYCDMKKYDLITEIINRYNKTSYFGQRKIYTNNTRTDLILDLYDFKLQDENIKKLNMSPIQLRDNKNG